MKRNKWLKIIFILLCILGFNAFSTLHAQEPVDTLKVDDILNMSFTDLMNVQVISASKTEQSIKNVSATVQVITAAQIKERGYFTLEEALSDLPGFQFRNIVGFNSYVFMRGAPSQNSLILLLVDGVQINELNSGGFYAGGQFNLTDIDRIEVVYGPASAIYGTNAVSGVINLITKKPEGKNKGHISLLGGNFKTGMGDFSFENYNPNKDFGYSVSGMYKTSEKADLRGTKGDNNWTNEMENFENDLSLSAKLRFKKFEARVVYQEKQSSMSTYYTSLGNKYLDKNTLWNIAFLNSFVKYTYHKNENWTFNSLLYYRNATVKPNTINNIIKATDTTAGYQTGYYRPNQLMGIENTLNFKVVEPLRITSGVIGEMEQLSDGFSVTRSNSQEIAPTSPSSPPLLLNYLLSYFVQADLKIIESLSFVLGIRHDFSSYYGQAFTPRLGLVFNKNKVTAKLLYNTAFRAPKPWDYDFGTGNSSLKPEKMQSLELFGSYLLLNHLSLGSSVYYNLIADKLVKETDLNVNHWVNKNNLSTFGFEFFANYSIRKLVANANYTYSNSYDQDDIFIPEISMHTANAGITYFIIKNFTINVRANFLGARNNPSIITTTGNNVISDALLLHGCISYFGFKGFDFQLKVNNILDQKYYHPSNLFAGRYRQPQRTITLKINYNF